MSDDGNGVPDAKRSPSDLTDEELSEIAEEVAEEPEAEVESPSRDDTGTGPDELWYPTVEDIIAVHDSVIEEDTESEPGIRNPQQIQFPIDYIRHGHFGQLPETIHEKAFHLLRLLAANHYFVDGNKRTALNTTEMFYLFNGKRFDTGEDIRALLKLIAVREELIDREIAVDFFRERSHELTTEDIEQLEHGVGLLLVLDALAEAFLDERFHAPADEAGVSDGDDAGDQKR